MASLRGAGKPHYAATLRRRSESGEFGPARCRCRLGALGKGPGL